MSEKRRYTITLPDHVADAVEHYARSLTATPSEYAADVIRWWFGKECPPLTAEEDILRSMIEKSGDNTLRIEKKPKVK